MHDYLPTETLEWCNTQLMQEGISLADLSAEDIDDAVPEGARLHYRAYSVLRDYVRRHILTGENPQLGLCPDVRGGYERVDAYGGVLQEIIEGNAQFIHTGHDIVHDLEQQDAEDEIERRRAEERYDAELEAPFEVDELRDEFLEEEAEI